MLWLSLRPLKSSVFGSPSLAALCRHWVGFPDAAAAALIADICENCKPSRIQQRDHHRQANSANVQADPDTTEIKKKIMAESAAAAGTVMTHAAMIVMKCERLTSLRRRLSSGA